MVKNPYEILELPLDADDDAIRMKYLEMVRRHPPEQSPEIFAEIRAAYEELKDWNSRLRSRVFEQGRKETIDVLIGELACRIPQRRTPLETLLRVVQGPH